MIEESVKHHSQYEATKSFVAAAEGVAGRERWMGVVFSFDDQDKLCIVRLTTWQFPREEFEAVMGLFKETLSRDEEPLQSSPLPAAPFAFQKPAETQKEGNGECSEN